MHLKEQKVLDKNTYRDAKLRKRKREAISRAKTKEWRVMGTCGGQK